MGKVLDELWLLVIRRGGVKQERRMGPVQSGFRSVPGAEPVTEDDGIQVVGARRSRSALRRSLYGVLAAESPVDLLARRLERPVVEDVPTRQRTRSP